VQYNRKHVECKHQITESIYCLFHDSCTMERGVFYSPWSYIITLSVFVFVTAIRKQISVLSAICCFYRVSLTAFLCFNRRRSVSRTQFASIVRMAVRYVTVRTSTFCCARLPHTQNTCKYSGRFCQIAELLLKSTENMWLPVGRCTCRLRNCWLGSF
jgi:hypothetical protein